METEAKSVWDTEKIYLHNQGNILEEIIPIRNKKGIITKLDINLIIRNNEKKEILILTPSIFSGINAYKKLIPGERILINLNIINNSNYTYKYVNNSFTISTKDLEQLEDKKNFINTQSVGFDQNIIYDVFSPCRTFNSAIKRLYHYTGKEEKEFHLTNDQLEKALKQKGYRGIEELDKYYLDFYNSKYNLKESSLDHFDDSIIKEMFSGTKTTIKETNTKLVALAYNYFYNKLLYVKMEKYHQGYSIGEYMRKELGNNIFQNKIEKINSKEVIKLDNIEVTLSKEYTTDAFSEYQLIGHMEFLLTRKKASQSAEIGLILPCTKTKEKVNKVVKNKLTYLTKEISP